MPLGFTKAHYKIPRRRKMAWPWAWEARQNFGVPFNISAKAEARNFKFGMQLGFAEAHNKITHRGKAGVALG